MQRERREFFSWEASFENKNVWNLLLYSMKCMGNGEGISLSHSHLVRIRNESDR